jgi:hypothetical protein
MKKSFIQSVFFSICLLVFTNVLKAQPTPPNGGGTSGGGTGVPVDGGITILAVAGVGYGVKKIRDARKNKKEICEESKLN